MLYRNEKVMREMIDLMKKGVPAYIEFNRFERDLKRIEAVRSEA